MVPQFLIDKLEIPDQVKQSNNLMRSYREHWAEQETEALASKAHPTVVVWDSEGTEELRVRRSFSEQGAVARQNAEWTLDYFSNILSHKIISGFTKKTLNININYGRNYPNGFWNGVELVLGNGDGRVFSDFTQSIDVMAHEIAHGIIQHTSNLRYYGEAGALNEHYADVLGTGVQIHILNIPEDKYDWTIANEIMIDKGEALRSMREPGTAYDNPYLGGRDMQPAHYKDRFKGQEDNAGVHINSGIMNKMFFLAARELGVHNAVRLWYEALLTLSANVKFRDAANALVNAAKKTGAPGSVQVIRWAAKEVGVL